jgi:lipopolysaccharide export LptBFGC system permease protein LptF
MFTASAKPDGYQGTRFSTYDITLDLQLALDELHSRPKEPHEMSIGELRTTIEEKRAAGEPNYVEQVELHRKFSIAFACLVFAAVGVPLGIQPTRAVHSRGFAVSLVFIFAYYLLLNLGQNLGERGKMPPLIAVWLPNLVLSCVALRLLSSAARDSPIASTGRVRLWLDHLRARFRRVES